MEPISYTAARTMPAELMDKATDDREAIEITRQGKESVLMLADSEYRSLLETAYLLRSPKNAQRLLQALPDAQNGTNLYEAFVKDLRRKIESEGRTPSHSHPDLSGCE